jgi:hypothetical protein
VSLARDEERQMPDARRRLNRCAEVQ